MTVAEALARVRSIVIAADAPAVTRAAAERLARHCGAAIIHPDSDGEPSPSAQPGAGEMRVRHVASGPGAAPDAPGPRVELRPDGSGLIEAPRHLLVGLATHLAERCGWRPLDSFSAGTRRPVAFAWQRSVFDFFLTQEGRIQRGMDKAAYLEALAARGFTHVEVNGLADADGGEPGVTGEIYPMFYTYCPALDQFVSTDLNAGLRPADRLARNLATLKDNARLALRVGLVPGLLCFEPRSVPDAFFERYPMLRGARVDHPFRSFTPRYNMTITHPLVLRHYAEMVERLLDAVPELGFLSIWSNDSGAGFEYTKSLYVGRNGGAYLVREWKDDAEIARAAGENVVRFLRTLRDAGRRRNPAFRVITRLESFYGEHETVWSGLGDGLDVETASLIARGWEMPYTHPRNPESRAINAGSVHQDRLDARESDLAGDLETRGGRAHVYMAAGPHAMFAPLVGVPYPRLTGRRLQMLHAGGIRHVAHLGGTPAPWLAPFDPNHELAAAVQFDPDVDVDAETERLAERWATSRFAPSLLEAWSLAERAILAYPGVAPLYSMYGFVWYRLWVRPLVPDIEAIALEDRAYYQDHMCTTPHNPNNVDLARDVLFQLTTPDRCRIAIQRMDDHVRPHLDRAVDVLAGIDDEARAVLGPTGVVHDQLIRLRALRCWLVTQRSVAAWVAGVHGYIDARARDDADGMATSRRLLDRMIDEEIDNSTALADLCGSDVEFMATAGEGETQLVHGRNLPSLLAKRVALMRTHRGDEPRIDPEYIVRMAGTSGAELAPGPGRA